MTRRRKIPLSAAEDKLLRRLYKQLRIPRDQFQRRPDDLEAFTNTWNRLSGRSDTSDDLLHYIRTQQKAGTKLSPPWPTFDGDHERGPSIAGILSEEEWIALEEAYHEVVYSQGVGTDCVGHDETLANQLSAAFAKRTRRRIQGLMLAAIIETRRKRGLWMKVGRNRFEDIGFDDLDEASGL